MLRICALVALVARKHIEVCTVKPDSVFLQFGKIPFHIERCLRCTEIALRSARPVTVSRYRSVRKAAGIIFIVARRCVVIIAVLVVNTEFVAEIMHRIDKRFHAFPSAGRLACRCVVRMLVVIPRFCPAVQMKIDFLYAEIMNFADLLFAHGKRHYAVIFLRILRIEKAGLRLHNRLDSRMNKTRSHKIVNGRILYCLFFQSAQMALFPYILAVRFAEVVIIAVI